MPTAADNTHTRMKVEEVHDAKDQMRFAGGGKYEERYGGNVQKNGIPYMQSYPRSAHPPKGSACLTVAPQGNPELATAIAAEHPDHRAKNQAEGGVTDMDMWGSKLEMKADGWHFTIGESEIHILRNGTINLKGNLITTEGMTKLGSPSASKEVSYKGTEDDGGFTDVGPVATLVRVV